MNKYNEFMNKIEVTDEMRSRILKNISEADFAPQKKSFFVRYRSWLTAAACLALAVVGAVVLTNVNRNNMISGPAGGSPIEQTLEGEPFTNDVQAVYDVAEYDSLEELSAAVGFGVGLPQELPFSYDSVSYYKMWSRAEIDWDSGENESACFRMEKSEEDISGDFREYEEVGEINADGITAVVKSSGGKVRLVVWNLGSMGYSLSVSEGITQEQAAEFVKAVTIR